MMEHKLVPAEPPTADDIEQCAAHLERLAIEYDKEQAKHTEGWQAAQWLRYLQAECERLRGEVVNRNQRALDGDKATAAFNAEYERAEQHRIRAESAERKLAECKKGCAEFVQRERAESDAKLAKAVAALKELAEYPRTPADELSAHTMRVNIRKIIDEVTK